LGFARGTMLSLKSGDPQISMLRGFAKAVGCSVKSLL
jgi:hypothetical protein